MLNRFTTVALLVAGCATPLPVAPDGQAWIAWNPQDHALVQELEGYLRENNMLDEMEFAIEFDPLTVVPESRIRAPFPEIEPDDVRLDHCQMGSTGGGIATLQFTPRRVSSSTAATKNLRCEKHKKLSASLCEFYSEIAYHLDDPANFFRIHEPVDKRVGLALMSRMAAGDFESRVANFPPKDWPEGWEAEHLGRFLSLNYEKDAPPGRYNLSLPGCGCSQTLVFDFSSEGSPLLLVDHFVLCI